MRVGILFTGISFGIGRDCRHCFPNIKSTLIDPFKKDHDVKIYLTSYNNDLSEEIINLYTPELATFIDYNDSHQVLTYIKSMEQIRNQNLDFVISTRFDIHFNKDMSQTGIDLNKFNTLFKERGWWNNMNFTTDNFFAFPYEMTEDFILALKSLYDDPPRPSLTDLHQAFYRLQNRIGANKTLILSNTDELSNHNSFYDLCSNKHGIKND